MKKIWTNKKKGLLAFGGIFLFLGTAHHTINFWERPASQMLVFFLLFAPLFIIVLNRVIQWLTPLLRATPKTRFYLLIVSVLLVGSLFSLRYYRSPETYYHITLAPSLDKGETIKIVEFKAGKSIIEIKKSDLKAANWHQEGDLIVATENSDALRFSFKAKSNVPIVILLEASPTGGEIEAKLGWDSSQSNTKHQTRGQTELRLQSRYRGIPNWIFIPLLVFSDIILFGGILLLLLLIQERGMRLLASTPAKKANHRKNLIVLLSLSLILHLFNSLATPLILDVDTPGYLAGALHLIKYGNLAGTSPVRGIASTFIFAPILFLFGRNPWGMKIYLHLFAIACVPLAYKIGWQLTKREKVAFFAGFFALLSPDLMLYSNYLWSDLINLFFSLVFLTALLSTLEKPNFGHILGLMLIGSLATLFRTENILLLPIGIFFLLWKVLTFFERAQWKKKKSLKKQRKTLRLSGETLLALLIAVIPLLFAAAHNQKLYGFFGLNNYAGESFYDGWVYYGDASKLNFSDQDSEAIKIINQAIETYPVEITDKSGVPTGWEIYPSLLKSGYTAQEAMDIFAQATIDSITNDWRLTLQFIGLKIQKGLRPAITHLKTLPLPGEAPDPGSVKENYFELEKLSIPPLIKLQRKINQALPFFYFNIYRYLIVIMATSAFFALYRKPSLLWLAFLAVFLVKTFMPIITASALWRLALAGLIPMQISFIAWIAILLKGMGSGEVEIRQG